MQEMCHLSPFKPDSMCVSKYGGYIQIVISLLCDSCCRSSEETIGQQGAESDHLGIAPDAHVPLPTHHPEARKERHKSDNGEMNNIKPSIVI